MQRESLLAPHAGNSQAPPCCPSLPLETRSFTSFSLAVQCQHQSPGILSLLHCRAHVSAKLGMGLFMLLPNGEQVSRAKKKGAAELVAIPADLVAIPVKLGQSRSRNLLLTDQSAAWPLIVVF